MNHLGLLTILAAVHACYTIAWPLVDSLAKEEEAYLAKVEADPHAAGKVV